MRFFCGAVLLGLLWRSGYGLCRRRLGGTLTRGESLAASLTAVVGLLSLLGTVLAFAGLFRAPCLVAGILLLAALLWLTTRRRRREPVADAAPSAPRWKLRAAWGLLLLAGTALFFRPDENLLGGWDPGVYIATGSHIAREGSWLIRDTASARFTAEEKNAVYGHTARHFVKYPGFYVDARSPHMLQPQFFPLYPVWIAGLSLASGLPLALFVSGVFAWLSLLMLLLAAREIGGGLCSILAGAVLLLSPVQIWFSGFHTAEIAMQFFFVAGLWLWALWQRTHSRSVAALSGGMFGLTAFASVTGIFLVALVAAAHLPAAWKRRTGLFFYFSLVLLLPLCVYQNWAMTPQYVSSVGWSSSLIRKALLSRAALIPCAALGAWFLFRLTRRGENRPRIPRPLLAAATFAGAAVVLALVARALYAGDLLHSRWLPAISLLSKPGVLCAFAGMAMIGWRRPALAPVVIGAPLLFAYVFFREGMMTAVYPWAFKRWLAVALPAASLFIGCFWAGVAAVPRKKVLTAAVLLAAALLIARPLYRDLTLALRRDWHGLAGLLAKVEATIPPNAIVVARRELGTPLEFVCGRPVLPLYADAKTGAPPDALNDVIRRCLQQGLPVCAVRSIGDQWLLPFGSTIVGEVQLSSSTVEQTRKPGSWRTKPCGLPVVVERLSIVEPPQRP